MSFIVFCSPSLAFIAMILSKPAFFHSYLPAEAVNAAGTESHMQERDTDHCWAWAERGSEAQFVKLNSAEIKGGQKLNCSSYIYR